MREKESIEFIWYNLYDLRLRKPLVNYIFIIEHNKLHVLQCVC